MAENTEKKTRDFGKWDTADTINLLGKEAVFTRSPGGFLDLDYKGKHYEKVRLARLEPLTNPEQYISVADEEEEIGIIPSLDALEPAQRELVGEVLRYKYFTPRILSVQETTERISYLFIDCTTSAGKKRICVSDYTSNMRQLGNAVSILDAQGNRYFIDDVRQLDRKSFIKLDQYL